MVSVSTKLATVLAALFLLLSSTYAGETTWPLNLDPDLSSGFGDFRPRRFHAGIDLRTGGQPGAELFSPADGHVWRVKTSYRGYGKGLYIKGKDKHIYVFGHLSDFAEKIDDAVKQAQIQAERYYVDLYFPADSIPVSKGELIGFTGQTGTGAPHLHFEKRTPDNLPLNPLTHGFEITDKTRPTFHSIGFEQVDNQSLFDDGSRKLVFEVEPGQKAGRYSLDTVLYFNRPFGVLTGCYDMMRPGGMKQAVFDLELKVDKERLYRIRFDTLDFEIGNTVGLNYDHAQAADGDKRVRRLFLKTGNQYNGIQTTDNGAGIIDPGPGNRIGLHEAKITARDFRGNKSELVFKFLWGPPDNVFHLDSTVRVHDSLHHFFFTAHRDYRDLDIDSIDIELDTWGNWHRCEDSRIKSFENDQLVVTHTKTSALMRPLRLVLHTGSGCVIREKQFSGMGRLLPKYPEMEYEIVDGGVIVLISSMGHRSCDFSIIPKFEGRELGILPVSGIVNLQDYRFFIPADTAYARIDHIEMKVNESEEVSSRGGFDCHLYLAGVEETETIAIDSLFIVQIGRDWLFEPNFIGIKKNEVKTRLRLSMNSDHYQVFPETFVTRRDFTVSYQLGDTVWAPDRTGMCWLDEEENQWVWLENPHPDGKSVAGESMGGGSFAAVVDRKSPMIREMNIFDGWKLRAKRPLIKFIVEDTLSGIEDDRSFNVTLDDRWLIPEYDPESGWFRTRPHWDLERGNHVLRISVVDRAGNKTERRIEFGVD